MPTPDRTTLLAVMDALTALLRENLVGDPPTGEKPLRRVAIGPAEPADHPRPFLTVEPLRVRTIGASDGDRIFLLALRLKIVTDVTAADAHGALLAAVGAVEDVFDALVGSELIDGADGLDQPFWSFELSATTAGARTAAASAEHAITVRVQRGQNRLPAP